MGKSYIVLFFVLSQIVIPVELVPQENNDGRAQQMYNMAHHGGYVARNHQDEDADEQ